MPVRILHLEDSRSDAAIIQAEIAAHRAEILSTVQAVFSKEEYLEALRRRTCDVILSDYRMPGYDGDDALRDARAVCPGVPFIMVTGELGEDTAVETVKHGATDFVLKDRLQRLVPSITRALREARLEQLRMRDEEALRRSEERFRTLFETMSEGFSLDEIICDETGRICDLRYLDVNPAFERHTGLKAADIVGHTTLELFPDAEPVWFERYGKVALTGEPAHFEAQFGPLGRWFEVSAYRTEPGRFAVVFFDITERKQLEEALRRSQEEHRTLFDTMLEGFCTIEMLFDDRGAPIDYRFLEINPMFERLTGLPEARGRRMRELAPENEQFWYDTFGRVALTGEPAYFEHEARALNRWLEVSAVRLGGMGSRTLAVLFNNITERKESEDALRRSEMIYRGIGEAINYGIWICEPDGRNIYASPSFLKLVGMTQEECSAFGWGDVLHPDDAEATIAAWQQCAREGTFWGREHRFKGTDGQYHHVLARGVPIKGANGEILCWAGINLDIADIKQAEESLRESEARFRVMADSTPVTIWVTNARGEIELVNHAYEEFFGVLEAQVKPPGTWTMLVHPDDEASYAAAINTAIRTRSRIDAEVRVRDRSGEWRWIHSYASPRFGPGGEFLGHVGSSLDVTEQKEAEGRLKRTAQNLHMMVVAAAKPMMVVDGSGLIEATSRAGSRLLGYDEGELIGREAKDLIVPFSRMEMNMHLDDLRKHAPLPGTMSLRAKFKDGSTQWMTVEARLMPVGFGDEEYLVQFEKLDLGPAPNAGPGSPLL